MKTVYLDDPEWNYIMGVLGDRPWRESNTVLLKIGSQLRVAANATEGIGQRPYSRAVSPREPAEIAPANSGDSAEFGAPGQASRR